MTANGILQIAVFFGIILVLTKPLGAYMARVFAGEAGFLRWAERPIYALAGIEPGQGQSWRAYAVALIAFHIEKPKSSPQARAAPG